METRYKAFGIAPPADPEGTNVSAFHEDVAPNCRVAPSKLFPGPYRAHNDYWRPGLRIRANRYSHADCGLVVIGVSAHELYGLSDAGVGIVDPATRDMAPPACPVRLGTPARGCASRAVDPPDLKTLVEPPSIARPAVRERTDGGLDPRENPQDPRNDSDCNVESTPRSPLCRDSRFDSTCEVAARVR